MTPWHSSDEEFRADHYRDHMKHEPRPLNQRMAVAQLVGICEGLVGSGVLGADTELLVRRKIAETLVAFGMPSKAERESV